MASAAASSWLESVIEKLQPTQALYQGLSGSLRFRSPRMDRSVHAMDECPDRKLGPDNNSHKNHNFAVCADRNVA